MKVGESICPKQILIIDLINIYFITSLLKRVFDLTDAGEFLNNKQNSQLLIVAKKKTICNDNIDLSRAS